MFNRLGVIRYPAGAASDDAMLEAAIEAGADNVESDAEAHEITCAVEDFFAVRDALETRFGAPETARLDWRPATTVTLDEDRAAAVLKLLDALEDNDDVQNVYANFDIPDAVMQNLSAWRLPQGDSRMATLLGIDPGLRFTGWGVIEVDGNRLRHVADGVIATDGGRYRAGAAAGAARCAGRAAGCVAAG